MDGTLQDTQARTGARQDTARLLVLFDGVCGLCDRSVQFLLKRDTARTIKYAPLQGPTAARLLDKHGVDEDLSTMIAVTDFGGLAERVHLRSDAVIQVLIQLGGIWWLLSAARILPRFVRDAVYRAIVKHRYRWFGRYDTCKVPTPEQRASFLD